MAIEISHVAIILDGNRRYAKKRSLLPWKGHSEGATKVKELIDWLEEFRISELTLYLFSMENFDREKVEVDELFTLFRKNIDRLQKDKRLHDRRIKIMFFGRLHLFPTDMQQKMKKLMESTKDYDSYQLNFAMAYGGKAEIVDACRSISEEVKSGKLHSSDITEEIFADHLYLNHSPDLIIRPGGERRVSNFLIWQGSYSEWYFTDKLWPEFTKKDFSLALDDYKRRKRRYGT